MSKNNPDFITELDVCDIFNEAQDKKGQPSASIYNHGDEDFDGWMVYGVNRFSTALNVAG